MLQWNFERPHQLHWHGNSYCNLDTTEAQRKGKEFICQLPSQNTSHKILQNLVWKKPDIKPALENYEIFAVF